MITCASANKLTSSRTLTAMNRKLFYKSIQCIIILIMRLTRTTSNNTMPSTTEKAKFNQSFWRPYEGTNPSPLKVIDFDVEGNLIEKQVQNITIDNHAEQKVPTKLGTEIFANILYGDTKPKKVFFNCWNRSSCNFLICVDIKKFCRVCESNMTLPLFKSTSCRIVPTSELHGGTWM